MQNLMVKRKKENTNVTLKNLKVIFFRKREEGKEERSEKAKSVRFEYDRMIMVELQIDLSLFKRSMSYRCIFG